MTRKAYLGSAAAGCLQPDNSGEMTAASALQLACDESIKTASIPTPTRQSLWFDRSRLERGLLAQAAHRRGRQIIDA